MAEARGFFFAFEVAPPELVAVVRQKASRILDTIEEEDDLDLLVQSLPSDSPGSNDSPSCDWLGDECDE